MPARITVYCTRSLAHLTGSYLAQWLDQADLLTLAQPPPDHGHAEISQRRQQNTRICTTPMSI